MKKPDNVADNPNLLPYGSNIGAPSIKVDNIEGWKTANIQKVNKELNSKFEELKEEYKKLLEEYELNQLVYSANYNFEPLIGEVYYLYYNKNNNLFLSIIKPEEWSFECVGGFRLGSNNKWGKI